MFIKLEGNIVINTLDVCYILTNPTNGTFLVVTSTREYTSDIKYLTDVKKVLDSLNNFYNIPDYGYINLAKMRGASYSEKDPTKFTIRYINTNNNLVISKERIPTMPDDFLTTIMAWTQGNGGGGGTGGVTKYAQLPDKPQIETVVLEGTKTLDDLGAIAKKDIKTTLTGTAGEIADSKAIKDAMDNAATDANNKYIAKTTIEQTLSGDENKIPSSKVVKNYVDGQVGGIDLTGYVPKTDIEAALSGTEGKLPDSKAVKDFVDESIKAKSTKNYTELTNKPLINGTELVGDKTSADLNLLSADTIVQTLDGNETDKTPSVQTVKTYIDTKDGETLNSSKQYTDKKLAEITGGGTIDLESYDEVKAYTANIKLNQNDLVIHNNVLYIVGTAVANTTNWNADKDNLIAVVDHDLSKDILADKTAENKAPTTKALYEYTYSKTDAEAKIDEKIKAIVLPDEVKAYAANIKLDVNDLVIHQDKLYIVKTEVANTTVWVDDADKLVAVVDLTDYYKKGEADTNFIPKADILNALDGNETDKVASIQAIKTAIDNITIALSTDIDADKAVENKAPSTKAVFEYTYSKTAADAKIDEKIAGIVIPDEVKLYTANIKLDQNDLIINNNDLYIVSTAVPNTTDWDTDNANFTKVDKGIANINYGIVENKPLINGVELTGDKTSTELKLLGNDAIVQTLDGDETDKVPSVITVKTSIQNSQKELSNDIEIDKDNQTKVTTPKAVYEFVQANAIKTENDGVYDITKIGKYYELYKKIRLQDGAINTQELKEIKVLEDTSINIVHASVCIDAHNLLISTVITDKTVNLIAVNMSNAPIDYRSIDVSLRILSTVKPNNGYIPLEPELKDAKLGINDEYGEDPYNPEDTKDNKAISNRLEKIIIGTPLDIPVELNGATYEAISDNAHTTVVKTDTNLQLNGITNGTSIVTVTFKKAGHLDKVRKIYVNVSKEDPDLQVTPTELDIIVTQTGSINITGTAAWTAVSKATDIATIDKPNGTGADTITVSTLKKGNTTIEIDVTETENTAAKKFTVNINVVGKDSDLSVNPNNISIEIDGTSTLEVTGNQSYTIESQNLTIAEVAGNIVTGKSEGVTNILVKGTADDTYNEKIITIPCTVTKKNPDTNLDKTNIEIATTETGIVKITHTKPVEGWIARIEDTNFATVNTAEGTGNADLTITGVTAGTTKLIVESKDNAEFNKVVKECVVVIKDRVQLVFPEGDIVTTPGVAKEVTFQSDAELGDISVTLEDPSFGTVEVIAGE